MNIEQSVALPPSGRHGAGIIGNVVEPNVRRVPCVFMYVCWIEVTLKGPFVTILIGEEIQEGALELAL